MSLRRSSPKSLKSLTAELVRKCGTRVAKSLISLRRFAEQCYPLLLRNREARGGLPIRNRYQLGNWVPA